MLQRLDVTQTGRAASPSSRRDTDQQSVSELRPPPRTFFSEVGFLALGPSLCFPFFISGPLESRGLCGVLTWLRRPFFPDALSLERTGTAPTATWGDTGHQAHQGTPSRPAHDFPHPPRTDRYTVCSLTTP